MRLILLITLCLTYKIHVCQSNESQSYRDFLRRDTAISFPLVLAGANHTYTTPGKVSNSGHGMSYGAAINPARLFTKKILLGVFVEFKIIKNLFWPYEYNTRFQSDLIANSNFEGLNRTDSLYATQFVNSTNKNDLSGNYGNRFGIMFAPSNIRYPMIKIYRKSVEEAIEAYSFNQTNFGTTDEYIYFKYRGTGIEILKFLRMKRPVSIYISLFYERDTISNSSIEEIKLNTFVNDKFFQEYKAINRFGFRIGLGRI